jgi:tetratricopeptide (TPR) repeat protein
MWSARQFTLDRPLFHQALDAALTIGDPAGVATAQTHAALCALIAGDGEDLRAQAVALSGTSAGGQNQIALRSHLLVGQTLATLEGRLADAEELSAEASEGRRVTGITDTDRAAAIAQFALRREQERLHELIPALTADAASPPAAAAFALMETGHRDDAAILLHRAGHAGFSDIPDDVDWPVAAALWSEVAARIGDRHAAAELYEILRPHDGIQLCSGGVACGPASRVLALVEVLLGRPADADRHFAEAIAFSRELMSPVWMARCQLDWAQTWLDRGETAWAAQLTDAADETAGALALPALGRQWATLRDQLDRT